MIPLARAGVTLASKASCSPKVEGLFRDETETRVSALSTVCPPESVPVEPSWLASPE